MTRVFFSFIQQLDSTVNSACVNETPVMDETECSVDLNQDPDLTTINTDTLSRLRSEEDQSAETNPDWEGTSASTPQEAGEELIGTCVTPSKIRAVQETLTKERERHLCALKLLPSFFSKEELATSNTDGTHEKHCLDSNKLKSLKVLVFSKFPVNTMEEKDRAWRCIKGKINSKCRAARKHLAKEVTPVRSL